MKVKNIFGWKINTIRKTKNYNDYNKFIEKIVHYIKYM